jgi:RHS repeat-associated protein
MDPRSVDEALRRGLGVDVAVRHQENHEGGGKPRGIDLATYRSLMRNSIRGQRCRWIPVLSTIIAASLGSAPAQAQLAPTGAHYAARSSDTGFSGAVNSQGGYSATVPLELPRARGDLPIPVRVSYGGHRFGAAGLGWEVPLSYILVDTTLARTRPFNDPGTAVQVRPRASLMLDGNRTELVRGVSANVWVAQRNGAQLEVRDLGNGAMTMYDGEGRTYHFSAEGPAAGTQLINGHLFLLRSVVGPDGNLANLEYGISMPTLPLGGTALAINLASVRYNVSPYNPSCYKDSVVFAYDAPPAPPGGTPPAPLAAYVLGEQVMVRYQKILSISVNSRATCTGAEVALRGYNFLYQADPDTALARLQSVTMVGQQGTPERNVTLPVASYTYGSATSAAGTLTYRRTQTIPLPAGVNALGLAATASAPEGVPPTTTDYSQTIGSSTGQNLIDLNGDGRPEWTFLTNGLQFAAKNVPAADGKSAFSGSMQVTGAPGSPVTTGSLDRNSSQSLRTSVPGGFVFNTDMVWRQSIDMNGDGRIDIIDAKSELGSWVVYLNTPAANDPSSIVWLRRTINIAPLATQMRAAGFAVNLGFLPLSQRRTGSRVDHRSCWQWTSVGGTFQWVKSFGGYATGACVGPPDSISWVGTEQSFVEWELKDLNGDGYPDLILDSVPAAYSDVDSPPPTLPVPVPNQYRGSSRIEQVTVGGNNRVQVLLNVAGMKIDRDTNPFAAPLAITTATGCAAEIWAGSRLVCGFVEVNGDGLPDRLGPRSATGNEIHLNTADAAGSFFAAAAITSVETLSAHSVPQYQLCDPATGSIPNNRTYHSNETVGLRDLNGDGLPDLVSGGAGVWHAQFGTTVGFGPAKPISVAASTFALSEEIENCGATYSETVRGLYDLDGDGQPEVLSLVGTVNSLGYLAGTAVDVYQLNAETQQPDVGPVASSPSAGRLIKIDSGYGAVTTIGYRSAKEDASTAHFVPFPEMVVASVGTEDSFGGRLETPTLYAYGGAALHYDPAYDAFVFSGYLRSVQLRISTDQVFPPPTEGAATLTDTNPIAAFDAAMDIPARFRRYANAGTVSDVTMLAGSVGRDPWALLTANVAADPRRASGVHYDWDARVLPMGTSVGNDFCMEMGDPYDYTFSLNDAFVHLVPDQCRQHGFVFQTKAVSWRGRPGTRSALFSSSVVRNATEVASVDDLGRVTSLVQRNDQARDDDDLCVQTAYANPVGTNERVLNRPASRVTSHCLVPSKIYRQETWEYDTSGGAKLPAGKVAAGLATGYTVTRRDVDSGALIGTIRVFDATYWPGGVLQMMTKIRNDAAVQVVTLSFDSFSLGLLATSVDSTNSNGTKPPLLQTIITRDPLTQAVLNTTDSNGAQRGNTFDGFGRVLLSTATPTGGTAGVLSSMRYLGFAAGDGSGRRVEQKVFPDPVAATAVTTAAGRTSTTYFDKLGRPLRTEVGLGADYANQTLIVGQRLYDVLGRVQFEADPFPLTESVNTAYGTSRFFNADGTPSCFFRGRGPQILLPGITDRTDEVNERYPTCQRRLYGGNREYVDVQDAASLLATSPQAGVGKETTYTATGRVIDLSTFKADAANNLIPIEESMFRYDAMGNLAAMTRLVSPTSAAAATTTWHYDSLGQMIELDAPASSPQFRTYDSWGNLTQVQWSDTATSPATDRRSFTYFDGLGRVTHRDDRNNLVVDPSSVTNYLYDRPFTLLGQIVPTNVKGRLAQASWPTGQMAFSYDGLGRRNATEFANAQAAGMSVEKHTLHGDGSEQTVQLQLPDTGFAAERVDYTYDSAGRARTANYVGPAAQSVASVTAMDVLGRVRQANYGPATFTASYADTGRKLINSVKVSSPGAAHSREIVFPTPAGFAAPFDPMGRERARTEIIDGSAATTILSSYDALGQLTATQRTPTSAALPNMQLTYDALGNVLAQTAATGGSGVNMSYQTADVDRICSIGYGAATPPTACNVTYDGAGDIVSMPSRTSGTRTLTYAASGSVKEMKDTSGNDAVFRYGAFGEVQQLSVTSASAADRRNEERYGSMVTKREENGVSVLVRSFTGPGVVATRHGPGATAAWTFAFGEERGTRFVTNAAGGFVQDVDYQAFGEARSTGAAPGSDAYRSQQWNGGDALTALGISQLGARLYDPVLGRFLSRDPLIIPRSASQTNPYAFAMNDPVNSSDPTGLDNGAECLICNPTPFIPILPFDLGRGPSRPGARKAESKPAAPRASGPVYGPVEAPHQLYGPWGASTLEDESASGEQVSRRDEGEPIPAAVAPSSPGPTMGDVVDWVDKGTDQPGNALDVIEYFAEKGRMPWVQAGAKILGDVTDAVQITIAGGKFLADPSVDTAQGVAGTWFDTVLMNSGPEGWGVYAVEKFAKATDPGNEFRRRAAEIQRAAANANAAFWEMVYTPRIKVLEAERDVYKALYEQALRDKKKQ